MRHTEQLFAAYAGLAAVIFFASVAEVEAAPVADDAVAAVILPTLDPPTVPAPTYTPVLGAMELVWPYDAGVTMVPLSGGARDLELQVDQQPMGAELRLNVDRSRVDQLQVSFRYQTSMSVGFEGPHWDLLDFAHYTSEWTDLPSDAAGIYVVPALNKAQRQRFSEVSEGQIYEAVRDYLSEWEDPEVPQEALCSGPHDSPCFVDVSRVTLRVRATRQGALVQESAVVLRVPMGG